MYAGHHLASRKNRAENAYVQKTARPDPHAECHMKPRYFMVPRLGSMLGLLVALVIGTGGAVQAQAIRGTLVDQASRAPISGAAILVLTPEGTRVEWRLTDSTGRFFVPLPGTGDYTLRAELIGHESTESPLLTVTEGDTLVYRMEIRVEAISLEGLLVEGGRRCEIRPSEGETVARVWDEARKALEATKQTAGRGLLRYGIRKVDRHLERDGRTVIEESTAFDQRWVRRPFVSLPADRLARLGFVQQDLDGATFFAPDSEVLLSDSFLDTHCFTVASGEDEDSGLMGLVFRPLEDRGVVDISGVLWLDENSARLKRLDFRYENMPALNRVRSRVRNQIGGQVVFEGLPTGAWLVRDWIIRMPILSVTRSGDRAELAGVKETGGTVTAISDQRGIPIISSWTGRVRGVVLEERSGDPVELANVWVDALGPRTTDQDGEFNFSGFLPGTHEVRYKTALLDSLGMTPAPTHVETQAGEEALVQLWVPSRDDLIGVACEGQVAPEGSAVIVGTALSAEDGQPHPDAAVQIVWDGSNEGGRRLRTKTAEDGSFTICGVPLQVPVRVRVFIRGELGPAETLLLSRAGGIYPIRLLLPSVQGSDSP